MTRPLPISVGDAPTVTGPLSSPLTQTREAMPVLADDAAGDPGADLNRLLARRLRQVFVILAVLYVAFLVIHLVITPWDTSGWAVVRRITLFSATVVQAAVAAVACLRGSSSRMSAVGEWVSLGVLWGAVGLNMFAGLQHPSGLVLLERGNTVGQSAVANSWLLPWFAVIAGYPVLVPHPPRRAGVIVGVTAAVPVVVTAAASMYRPDALSFENTWVMYVHFAVWGLVACGIAVYGARQAALLRKEAFEAKKYGQYRLVRRLDGGGMGEVFLAEHQLLRRPSVIKLIRPDRRTDPKMMKRFEREVKRLATLTHWNTVEVYDYGHTADGTFYFVMEYLPGVNLHDLVTKHGPLPPGRAAFLVRQVCRGLREAHGVGLIHRDIKPANVMACERGGLFDVAKLLDFGLVRSAEDDDADDAKLTRDGAILGTPAYLSPEQARGERLDPRSDVYSLGCTLFFLLTGRPPFDKPSGLATAAAHLHEPPPTPAGAPPDLAAVVLKCLQKDRADRYGGVRELEDALTACGCAAEWDHDRAEAWWKGRKE
jgi:serine/threonine-protein kinase